jgi:hypothetical protein
VHGYAMSRVPSEISSRVYVAVDDPWACFITKRAFRQRHLALNKPAFAAALGAGKVESGGDDTFACSARFVAQLPEKLAPGLSRNGRAARH